MCAPATRTAIGLLLASLPFTAGSAPPPAATVVLATRSIGSRRGQPPARQAHAALLVRFEGRPGGFIVQGGPSPLAGSWRTACAGWVIPSADPDKDFTRAVGAWWGEDKVVRELPTQVLATFAVPALDEARLRALVQELGEELRPHSYRLKPGPSSNSFISRLLGKLRLSPPAVSEDDLPGWGWRP